MLLPRFGGRTMLVTSTADRRPPTADRRPPITDHRSPITAARAPPSEPSGPNKTAARERGRQTADEPHVFVSVGFCLSGIRIAGS
ncbi:hypothetical protein, partial [Burkholderia pseudomallei]|uniref:hypothetical protein n=1 Tax=Burkholderia pseudomallei TaxID=28450 RepID=UPI001E5D82AA